MSNKTTRRDFLKKAFGTMAATVALPLTGFGRNNKSRPNILFLAVDDLRTELKCYGVEHVKSPNIDTLAEQGFLAERAYVNVPVCGASRASLLTGARPKRDRFVNYYTWAEKDYPNCKTLPKFFKDQGYHAISNGKVFHHKEDYAEHWSEKPWRSESNRYALEKNKKLNARDDGRGLPYEAADVSDEQYRDGDIANKSINDLKRMKEKGQPFFLAAGFRKPHLPFNAPKKYWDLYDADELPMADNNYKPVNAPDAAMHNWGELRNYENVPQEGPVTRGMAKMLIHGYNACVSYTDAQIGKILQALEDLDMVDNTVVILWGDHGWNLEEHTLWCKHCNFDNALRAPLIVKAPGIKPARTDGLIEFIDIYPTLCELAGFTPPEHCAGESFVPLMKNPDQEWNDPLYCRWYDGKSIRTDRYLYTEWKNDKGETYARMLYDHWTDPQENVNIAERPENKKLVEKLSSMLYAE